MISALKTGTGRAIALAAIMAACVPMAHAQRVPGGMMGGGELPSTTLPPELGDVSIDQKLGAQIPLDLPFRDENGQNVTLRRYFTPGRPVVLSLVYYDCPLLCTQVLNGMASTLRILKLNMGKDYEVVTVSFDPHETPRLAAAKKKAYLLRFDKPGGEQGWHFLTGDQASITALTNAVGFHYQWDEKLQQFAHATAIMVATPDGKLSQYFFGVDYPPNDLRLALVEASDRKIGTPMDAVLLYCYHYDPRTGRYGVVITNILRIAGVATVLILGSFIVFMFVTEPNKKQPVNRNAVPSRPIKS